MIVVYPTQSVLCNTQYTGYPDENCPYSGLYPAAASQISATNCKSAEPYRRRPNKRQPNRKNMKKNLQVVNFFFLFGSSGNFSAPHYSVTATYKREQRELFSASL